MATKFMIILPDLDGCERPTVMGDIIRAMIASDALNATLVFRGVTSYELHDTGTDDERPSYHNVVHVGNPETGQETTREAVLNT